MIMTDHFAQVLKFNEAARGDLPHTPTELTLEQTKLALRLVLEESFEVVTAMFQPESATYLRLLSHHKALQYTLATETEQSDLRQDNVELLDGLCDTVVVVMGMAAMAGLPLNEGMDEVNASNLAKIDPVSGKCIKDAGGKIQKPEGWKKPDLCKIIEWCHKHGNRHHHKFEQPVCVEVKVHHKGHKHHE
jgi:predicted HAD superfamily Cof-like phosphohydrolase